MISKQLNINFLTFDYLFDNWDLENKKFKLPFDDPNIFDAFYNSFASSKNREAIKRRYSGLQAVLTPS